MSQIALFFRGLAPLSLLAATLAAGCATKATHLSQTGQAAEDAVAASPALPSQVAGQPYHVPSRSVDRYRAENVSYFQQRPYQEPRYSGSSSRAANCGFG